MHLSTPSHGPAVQRRFAIVVRELGRGVWHSNRTSAQCHRNLIFTLEDQKTWVCRKKMCSVLYGDALKLISPIGHLIIFQRFFSEFPKALIFQLSLFIIRVCCEIFRNFFQKLKLWKKIIILIFPKSEEKIKIRK